MCRTERAEEDRECGVGEGAALWREQEEVRMGEGVRKEAGGHLLEGSQEGGQPVQMSSERVYGQSRI